jgi:hypothetical protein
MIAFVFAACILGASPPQECVGSSSAPALDHVILVVRDLDVASAGFRSSGFILKQGRLHANNLLNRHIKFRDGSSIELMMVRGVPGDAMARDYVTLAAAGEGGVYVALKVPDIEDAKAAAIALELRTQESRSGPWHFLSFPSTSPAAAVFFSAGSALVQDSDSLLNHVPGVDGLAEVWLEGGPQLVEHLEKLGAERCGSIKTDDGRIGDRIALSRGRLVILPPKSGDRPRVLGVVLKLREDRPGGATPHPSFWVRYEY